jgi:hypothetical protein
MKRNLSTLILEKKKLFFGGKAMKVENQSRLKQLHNCGVTIEM